MKKIPVSKQQGENMVSPLPTLLIVVVLSFAAMACDEEGGLAGGLFIETDALEDGRVQMQYEQTLEVSDAAGEVVWTVVDGALPDGLELSGDGVLSGLPERSGDYSFAVRATDDAGEDEVDLELTVPPVLLMSGFEPFGGYESNPSYDAIAGMDEEMIDGLDVRVIEIPVTWAGGWTTLLAEIERLNVDLVVATGVAGSDYMRLETRGRNIMEQTDNDDVTMNGEEIVEGGPDEVFDGLPVQEMADAMIAAGYPAQLSDDAGTYLCNHVLYNLMYYVENLATRDIDAGFIHVPPVPTASFELDDITAAHRVGIGVLASWYESGEGAQTKMATIHAAPVY